MHKKTVIEFFGTQAAVGRALHCTQANISQWKDIIPKGRAYELESITHGQLTVDLSLYREQASAVA